MYCPQCGMELPDWARFCERCGERVIRLSTGASEDDEQRPVYDAAAELAHAKDELDQKPQPSYDMPTSVLVAAALRAEAEAQARAAAQAEKDQEEQEAADEELPELVEVADFDTDEPAPFDEGVSEVFDDSNDVDLTDYEVVRAEDPENALDSADEALEDEPEDGQEPDEDRAPVTVGRHAAAVEGEDDAATEEDDAGEEAASDDAEESVQEPELAPEPEPEPEPESEHQPEPQPIYEGVYDAFAEPPVRDPNSPFDVVSNIELHQRYREPEENTGWGPGRLFESPRRGTHGRTEPAHDGPPMALIAGIATAAMVFGCLVLFRVLGLSSGTQTTTEAPQVVGNAVTRTEAARIIASLDGWWTTNRELDGRYWHIEGALVSTYAADGKLASEVTLDPRSVERMSTGPGGIDKPGYYLRDIAFYLADDDPDTLHALAQDGSADEDADLIRTTAPPYAAEGTEEQPVVEEEEPPQLNTEEYMLPEADTRVYTPEELESLSNHDLFVARYEIFARHGCIFKEGGELAALFASKPWYQQNPEFNDEQLTDIERQNMEVIRQVEASRNSEWAGV